LREIAKNEYNNIGDTSALAVLSIVDALVEGGSLSDKKQDSEHSKGLFAVKRADWSTINRACSISTRSGEYP
jgi:hypothetical protein